LRSAIAPLVWVAVHLDLLHQDVARAAACGGIITASKDEKIGERGGNKRVPWLICDLQAVY
jgi:hypothetical protein